MLEPTYITVIMIRIGNCPDNDYLSDQFCMTKFGLRWWYTGNANVDN